MNAKNSLKVLLSIAFFIYFGASFFYDPKYVIYIKPILIPLLSVFIFFDKKQPLSKKYVLFVLFFYISETSILLMELFPFLYKIGLFCSFLSYLFLVSLAKTKIRSLTIFEHVKPYELFVFSFVIVILIFVLHIIFNAHSDLWLNSIIVLNAISGVLLVVVSFVYLKEDFNKKSVYYFFGSLLIFFSDLMSALNQYFLDSFPLNFSERVLHFLGFYLVYLFFNEKIKKHAEL